MMKMGAFFILYVFIALSFATVRGEELSLIAKQNGFTHAIHTTHASNLEGILQSRFLMAGCDVKGAAVGDPFGNHNAIFLSLAAIDESRLDKLLIFVRQRLPILVFSLEKTLDCYPFYANIGHMCGRYFTSDAPDGLYFRSVDSGDQEGFASFVANSHAFKRNEVVFSQPIPLSGLVCLYVKKGEKAALIEYIRKRQIPAPEAGLWEEIIVEVAPLHDHAKLLKLLTRFL